jgi:hypothetical protein
MNAWAAGENTIIRTFSAGAYSDKPLPPSDLTARGDSASIVLNWSKSFSHYLSPNIRYNVYRRSNPSLEWDIIKEDLDSAAYTDSLDLAPETSFYYHVRSFFSETEQESDPSGIATAWLGIIPLPPKDITYSLNKKWVSLKWNPPSTGSFSYLIYRKSDSDTSLSLIEKDCMYQSYTDRDISLDGNYYYALQSKGLISGLLSNLTSPVKVIVSGVEEGSLSPEVLSASVYPNPVTGRAFIYYTLPAPGRSRITLVNTLGSELLVLSDEYVESGTHTLEFNIKSGFLNSLAPSLYYIRIESCGRCIYRKVIII